MLFNSYEFVLLFLPATLAGVFILPRYSQVATRLFLVVMSLLFYAWWSVAYLPLLLASIAGNFALALLIERSRSKAMLIAAIALNLAALGYFKYLSFFSGVAADLTGLDIAIGQIVLPLGISFFTFQQIAYQVDRWSGAIGRHGFLDYILLCGFFPHLLAGPIVRHSEFLPQLNRQLTLRGSYLLVGLTLFGVGLFKKVLVADSLSPIANPVFAMASQGGWPGFEESWRAALAYTFQIYFDFSGYSDMAIGLGLMFGFRFPINFHAPYRSASITQFWRRWHMTLSRFLRDYLYISLGGSRRGRGRGAANLVAVMLLGGLWHGAAWTFVAWGLLHGAMLAAHHAWGRFVPAHAAKLPRATIGWIVTFVFVVFSWVMFRADSVAAATRIWSGMVHVDPKALLSALSSSSRGPDWMLLAASLLWVMILPTSHRWLRRYMPTDIEAGGILARVHRPFAWRMTPAWAVGSALIFAAAFLGLSRSSEFLYYNF